MKIIYDDIIFNKDKNTGYYLGSKKVNGKRLRLHRYIWCKHFGEIPQNMHIHHKDENKDNNDISNLELLSNSEHTKFHKSQEENIKKSLISLKIAQEKAVIWHKSEEGKVFHKELSKMAWDKRETRKYNCTQCGDEFETRHIYSKTSNHFCHNNCKARFRRERIKSNTCLQNG